MTSVGALTRVSVSFLPLPVAAIAGMAASVFLRTLLFINPL